MPLNLIGFRNSIAGPLPVCSDDAEEYPAYMVVWVRDWLQSLFVRYARPGAKPSDQIISIGRPELGPKATTDEVMAATRMSVEFTERLFINVNGVYWEAGTAEILERDRATKVILRSFEFLIARDKARGRVICGPELRATPKARDTSIPEVH